ARLSVVLGDAAEVVAQEQRHGSVDVLQVDLYDHEAAAPVLDSEEFYADCRKLLTEDGCMTVNLFGRASSYGRSLEKIAAVFAREALWAFRPTGPRLRSGRKQLKLAGVCRPASGCGFSSRSIRACSHYFCKMRCESKRSCARRETQPDLTSGQASQRGAWPFWPQPAGNGAKTAPLVVTLLAQAASLGVVARLDWRCFSHVRTCKNSANRP